MPIAETAWRWAIYRKSDLSWASAGDAAGLFKPAARAVVDLYQNGADYHASREYYRIIDGLAGAGLLTISDAWYIDTGRARYQALAASAAQRQAEALEDMMAWGGFDHFARRFA